MKKILLLLIIVGLCFGKEYKNIKVHDVKDHFNCETIDICSCWIHNKMFKDENNITLRHFSGRHICLEPYGDQYNVHSCDKEWCGPCCMTLEEYIEIREYIDYNDNIKLDFPIPPTPPSISSDY